MEASAVPRVELLPSPFRGWVIAVFLEIVLGGFALFTASWFLFA